MKTLLALLFIAIALAVIAAKTFVLAKGDERLVVFRLGKLLRVSEPGLVMVVPFVDRVMRIRLDSIAGWRGFSKRELEEKVVQQAMSGDRM